jgi:iron(III) transport system ATP-binding protein
MLVLKDLTKRFPRLDHPAVDGLNLTLEKGEIVALAGSSGSGKTTALRLIAGFDRPDGGTVSMDGSVIADRKGIVPPEQRNIGVVFQDFALFPHLTVGENVGFGLRNRPAAFRRRRVEELLALAGIPDLGERYPHEISGGQQQRVALVRALAPEPAVVLLDEPFSNLDHTCTHRLLAETRHIIKGSGSAAIVVTHDRYEAFTLADRIAVLKEGRLQQLGSAEEIYAYPATREVAEFSGSASFVPVWTTEDMGDLWLSPLGPVPDDVAVVRDETIGTDSTGPDRYFAVVRPHQLILHVNGRGCNDESTSAVVKDIRFLGSVLAVRIHVDWPSSHSAADGWDAAAEELLAHVTGSPRGIQAGETVNVAWC